ncbi:MAG TPA: FdrA family protein [Chloroflexota bacterium]
MALRWVVRPNAYYDSVKLMRVSDTLSGLDGVERAAAVMATPLNRDLLADDGLLPPEVEAAPDDLLVAVLGRDEQAAGDALARLDDLLQLRRRQTDSEETLAPPTIEAALDVAASNLAVIAVPGPYAAAEAFAALRRNLHVFLFSDNVPLAEEIRLKRLAAELDLLMMGPDCGTAIIGGVGLGFANRVERGPVGIVGASGTGIQQVSSLLDAAGIGIAQAIGTGGRDLSSKVGGSMTRRAVAALKADSTVEIVVVISKPADERTALRLHRDLLKLRKPAVVCLLGTELQDEGTIRYADNLTEAASVVADIAGAPTDAWRGPEYRGRRGDTGLKVYGLFSGGTLCTEAARALDAMDARHSMLDLGADEYTQGRAHPMIDPRLRASMIADLRGQDDAGAVLLDVVLGDLAHPDPAGVLLPALAELDASRTGSSPRAFVSLIGTRRDPQGLAEQRAKLEDAGALVFASNVEAARAAGRAIGAGE